MEQLEGRLGRPETAEGWGWNEMWFAQDNKREAGTAAGFGSEMHGELGVQAGLQQTAVGNVCTCVYVSEDRKQMLRRNHHA